MDFPPELIASLSWNQQSTVGRTVFKAWDVTDRSLDSWYCSIFQVSRSSFYHREAWLKRFLSSSRWRWSICTLHYSALPGYLLTSSSDLWLCVDSRRRSPLRLDRSMESWQNSLPPYTISNVHRCCPGILSWVSHQTPWSHDRTKSSSSFPLRKFGIQPDVRHM